MIIVDSRGDMACQVVGKSERSVCRRVARHKAQCQLVLRYSVTKSPTDTRTLTICQYTDISVQKFAIAVAQVEHSGFPRSWHAAHCRCICRCHVRLCGGHGSQYGGKLSRSVFKASGTVSDHSCAMCNKQPDELSLSLKMKQDCNQQRTKSVQGVRITRRQLQCRYIMLLRQSKILCIEVLCGDTQQRYWTPGHHSTSKTTS